MKKILLSCILVLSFAISAMATGHTVTTTFTNVTCFGACNGSITASVSGGVGPFTYDWTPGSPIGDGTNAISGLCAGTYTITVTDNSDMSIATAVRTISQPAALNVSLSGGGTVCMGACTTLLPSVSGGTPGYTYSWSGGLFGPTPSVCPPATTTYTVTVTDMNGCVGASTTTVTPIAPPTITLSPAPAFCGACNGSIISNAPGAIAYSWVGPGGFTSTVSNIFALCPGTYTLTTTDGAGCVSSASTNVIFSLPITTSVTSVTNATCGLCDGTATITPSGGTPPYTYSWIPSGVTSASAVGLCAGTYTATVTDANGCTATTLASVNNTSGPTSAAITTVNTSCTASTGQLNIGAVTGGVAPYTYSINGGAFTSTVSYTGLSAGTYNVAIKDVNGCIVNQMEIISLLNPPVVTLDSINGISCTAGTTGNIFLNITSGTPAYSILWSNGATSIDLTNINTYGNYTVTVSDAAGCAVNNTYYISSAVSVYGLVTSTPINCTTLGTATVSAYGGTAPYTFAWNTIPVQTSATATGLAPGTYNCIITDAGGCSGNALAIVPNWGCSNIIKGKVYEDVNSNCIQDAGEPGLVGRTVIASPGAYYATTDVNGDYILHTPNMNNTVTVSPYSIPSYSPTCPVTGILNVNFSTLGDSISNNDFGYYINPTIFNLGIHPGWSTANPGFTKNYWVYPINASPTSQTALIRFVYDSNLVFNTVSPGGIHFPAQKKIEWTVTLPAAGYGLIWGARVDASFAVPASMSITSSLTSYFEILPIIGDSYPSDNTLLVTEPVTGCRDPNAKSVIPEGVGPNGNIFQSDSVLFYTIHFQNNGNDTAHFVVVTDTLSSFLAPATVVPGASDHPYTFELSGAGIMNFRFDNIMLPDSTTDEPKSNGYFNYTVKVKTGTPVGSVINNTASIYFDYNEAVVTNTTINTIVDIATSIESASTNNVIKVYPNPFSDNTTFVIQSDKLNEVYSFELTDVLGKKVKSQNGITEKQFEISREGLQNGIYFYKIYTSGSIVGIGKVIIK